MPNEMQRAMRRLAGWWIVRNPLYLLSAACMAVGAKLYLFAPDARAGEIGLILLTLGVLQIYEVLVCGIAYALHRHRRSPEDQPSLLLVGALFWTGPLAATLELSQGDARLGQLLALAVAIFAALELLGLKRGLGLRLTPHATISALACIALIALGQPWLRIADSGPAAHEVALYMSWWLLAAALLPACAASAWRQRRATPDVDELRIDGYFARLESIFILLIAAAAVTHLYAFNYAFFGHARAFYAAPLLAVLALYCVEQLAARSSWSVAAYVTLITAPLAAIAISADRFDAHFDLGKLPYWLRDPLPVALALTALVWWFACLRLKSLAALHAGSAAACVAFLRFYFHGIPADAAPVDLSASGGPLFPLPLGFVYVALALAAYLFAIGALRGARRELALGLSVFWVACVVFVAGRTDFDRLIMPLTAGWTWLGIVHVLIRRPAFWSRIGPLLLLTATACFCEFDETLNWTARGHMIASVVALGIVAWWRPASGYRFLASVSAAPWLVLLLGRSVAIGQHAGATVTVTAAFALLCSGAAVSWHKQRLLRTQTEV